MMYAGFAMMLFSIILRLYGAEALPLILGIIGFIMAVAGAPYKWAKPEPDPWEEDEKSEKDDLIGDAWKVNATQTNVDTE